MALKRKASFTTITSPRNSSSYYNSTSPIPCMLEDVITIDETPRHLHSRTRKRLRNDRPGDQEVYDKTLGWLFSAQKQSNNGNYTSSTNSSDEAMQSQDESTGNTTSSLKPDPNQQTLFKFFQTGQARPSPVHTLPSASNLPNNFTSQTSGSNSPSVWAHHSGAPSAFSAPCDVDMDVDMQMDMDSNATASSGSPQEKTWVGGIGWM